MHRAAIAGSAVVLVGVWMWSRPNMQADAPSATSIATPGSEASGSHRTAARERATQDAAIPWAKGQDPMAQVPFDGSEAPADARAEHADPATVGRARAQELVATLSAKADAAERDGNKELANAYRERVSRLRNKLDSVEPVP